MTIRDMVAAQRAAQEKDQLALMRRQDADASWQGELRARRDRLRALHALLLQREEDILAALHADLGKSAGEAYMTELGLVLSEISFVIRHLRQWMRPRRLRGTLATFPSKSLQYPEPYGLVLILSPWNYPFQLAMMPLIGAIAAGNRCLLKPSSQAPHTARMLHELITAWVAPELAVVVQGDRGETSQLWEERFDYIFFTGGAKAGKWLMGKAAEHLTPVTMELGGKSPCIVDESADIDLASRRIAFGKGINAGQTCVAPDYLLVHESVKQALLQGIHAQWQAFNGADALTSPDWPRINGPRHYARLMALLEGERVFCGGQGDGERIAPTLIDNVRWGSPLMQEEIFGPLMPVIGFTSLEDALKEINRHEKPLALYLFSEDARHIAMVRDAVPFGGGCVNDTLIHLSSPHLPFGGVGASGMGSYHGKESFETFSHHKSVLQRGKPDYPFRFPPFTAGKLSVLKRFLK
ncbi:MAG: aldehyde dehydrogenase family protein [Christensenellales bacterium]